ncbi:MAG: nuclear transport factor 2 family protein [Bacteroidota bacterium]|nr:nuclear transport factor 2 family protein [Bacteroidota bacterium]
MRYAIILALMAGLGLLPACRQSKSTDDPEKLKTVLLNYFDGIKNNDHKKMIDATTDDFIVYETGKVWNNDSVFKEMKRVSPYTVNFKFDNFKIQVDNMSGHMSYYEEADFVFNDTLKVNLNFLGSAAFQKNEGGWKMNFLHATKKYAPKVK